MSEEPKGPKPQVDSDYSELPAIETDVFIAGSGPIGATFCRKILEENSLACVYMAEIGSQDHPVIGAHHKNSVKYHKDIDSFVHVIQGALQPISVPSQSTFMSTLGEVAWTPGPGQHLIQSYHNPNQKPEDNLMSYMTRTVGGMATHWTCACPMPDPDEMKNCPLDEYEFKSLLKQAQKLLSVNTNEFDHSIRHNLVKQALIEHYNKDRVANLPLAVTRCPKNPEFAIWSGVDTILGGYIDTQKDRFTLATETRVTKLIFEPVTGSTRIIGALCRDLRNNRNYVVRAKHYVVTCGAIGTPQILFNSNIRPKALGHYLTEQSLTFCQIVLKRSIIDSVPAKFPDLYNKHREKHKEDPLPIPFNDPEPQVTMPYSSKLGKLYHVQIHRDAFAYGGVGPRALVFSASQLNHTFFSKTVVDLRFFGKQDIQESNCVTFAEPVGECNDGTTDGYGMPQATFHVRRNKNDAERDHKMMKDMCEAAGVLGAYLPGSEPQFMEPGLVLHITGTTRLGRDPETSVADENSKVHNLDNVYVGGNNVIPDSTACNPTLTSVAYAIRAARHILDNLPGRC